MRQWALLAAVLAILAGAAVRWGLPDDSDSDFDWGQVPPWPVFTAVLSFDAYLPKLLSRVLPPPIRLAQLSSSFIQTKALYAAAELGVSDALAGGPLPVEQLAAPRGVKPDALCRVLRLLASMGIFKEVRPGVFANNRVSGLLRRDHPTSLADLVMVFGDESFWAFTKFTDAMALDAPHPNAFATATGGLNYWQWLSLPENAGRAERFDRAMTDVSNWNSRHITQDYGWAQHANQTVADIGGGQGGILASILASQPTMRGVLFDRPPVVERAAALWAQKYPSLVGRVEMVAGDFFQGVPKADVYFMQHILHDWQDVPCIKILRNLRTTIGTNSNARLLIADIALPDSQPAHYMKRALDLQMMAVPDGRERSVREWSALLAAGGFRLERMVPLRALESIIVAVPLPAGEDGGGAEQ